MDRLPESEPLALQESQKDVIPVPPSFEINPIDPDAPDFWTVADCAAKNEEKEKHERLRNERGDKY